MYLIVNLKVNILAIAIQIKVVIRVEVKLIVVSFPAITDCTYGMLSKLFLIFLKMLIMS